MMPVWRQIFFRGLTYIFILFLLVSFTQTLTRWLPGNPIDTILAETGTSLSREAIAEILHLNHGGFFPTLLGFAQPFLGNFGNSLISQKPVGPILSNCFWNTLEIVALSCLLWIPFSLFLGILSIRKNTLYGKWASRLCDFHSGIATALPTPWITIMMILIFTYYLPIFDYEGRVLLPAITLALVHSGFWSRFVRQQVTDSLLQGSALGARARGMAEWRVIIKYGLRPSAGILLGTFGSQLGHFMAGSFVVEVIFNIDGMGVLLVDSVLKRDYPVIQAAVFLAGTFCLIGNLLGDLSHWYFNPRGRV